MTDGYNADGTAYALPDGAPPRSTTFGAGSRQYTPGAGDALANWLAGGNYTKAMPSTLNHGDYMGGYLQNQLGQTGSNPLDFSQANSISQQQGALAQQLQGVASGQQQGAGELAVQRQMGQAAGQQQALARMARGSNAALAARGAARNTADLGVAGAGQSQIAALQDQTAARGQLAGVYGQQQQGAYQQQGMNQQQYVNQNNAQLGYLQQMQALDQAQAQLQANKAQVASQDTGHGASMMQQAGQMIAMSDERLKADIRSASDDADSMMAALHPVSYRYKDERHGAGYRLGILAQDLEESSLGKSTVVETSDGKGVDIVRGISASLAGIARLHERLEAVEKRKRGASLADFLGPVEQRG